MIQGLLLSPTLFLAYYNHQALNQDNQITCSSNDCQSCYKQAQKQNLNSKKFPDKLSYLNHTRQFVYLLTTFYMT